ncbi:hypothetical protein Pcinc_008967 [Petrolisthes cinctipes]|uniref:Uncharacterized protein n=1 Tax=Petrolisthes cinctipes TaxID=88211 RepID=A0AAE1KVY7_PETCI|nr:hypothetical protein Pcinc_008967 [Petrolisthes cinctipes]
MDPHMTEDDAKVLGMGHHRRLEQRLAPPSPVQANHPSIMSKKKLGDEGDRKTRTSNTVEWDLDDAKFRGKEESEDYFCDNGSRSEPIYQEDCPRKDNRSVKERREDFRNVHERQQSFPEEKDLVSHRRSSIPEDIGHGRRFSIPDNFLDRHITSLVDEGKPTSKKTTISVSEQSKQARTGGGGGGGGGGDKRRPSIPEENHNIRGMLNKTNHTIASHKAKSPLLQEPGGGGRVRRPPDIAMTQRSHSTASWDG